MATVTPGQGIPPNPTRRRSFGGCATCRSRHVKCDEARPTCSMCRFFGFICAGYEKEIFFDFEASNERGIRFRRPLLTEKEREHMSRSLVCSVSPESALHLLSRIDVECERASVGDDIQVYHGPFGAFKLGQSNQQDTSQDTTSSDLIHVESNGDFSNPSHCPLSPGTERLLHSIFDPSGPSSDIWNMTSDLSAEELLDGTLAMSGIPSLPPQGSVLQPSQEVDFNNILMSPISSSSIIAESPKTVPEDATILLKHYVTTVINLMTPLQHTKTPWHILFIPHAKSCLAAFALCEDLDDASLSAFYGTLAISGFSLGGLTGAQMWTERAKLYRQQAQEHARLMLKTAYNIPKVAKYKSILIGLLTMVYVSVYSANRDQMEYYFLETEKFIRLRGLKRNKSRKVRLLHHCYAFERLLYESTFTGGANSGQRLHVRTAVESSGLLRYSRDSLSFRLPVLNNLEQEMLQVKSQEEGENDLHLERPGVFSASLYPEVFGVHEPWIMLLSLVIRLGKEKDLADQSDMSHPLSFKDFTKRAKAIEIRINNLQRPSQANDQSQINQDLLQSMLDAMHHALGIYFYRRIYDMEASMLQDKVVRVRDCLLRCESTGPSVLCVSVAFIWPAFVAACEAEDPEVQVFFRGWFKSSAQRSGMSSFHETLARVERIWEEKRSKNGNSATWLDLTDRASSYLS